MFKKNKYSKEKSYFWELLFPKNLLEVNRVYIYEQHVF